MHHLWKCICFQKMTDLVAEFGNSEILRDLTFVTSLKLTFLCLTWHFLHVSNLLVTFTVWNCL